MSTLKVQMNEHLLMQVMLLAAHDGMSPSQFIEAALVEKLDDIELSAHLAPLARGMSLLKNHPPMTPATIISMPEAGATLHDHLRPYSI